MPANLPGLLAAIPLADLPKVEADLAGDARFQPSLAHNPNLTAAARITLAASKLPVGPATKVFGGTVPFDTAMQLARNERRQSPVTALVDANADGWTVTQMAKFADMLGARLPSPAARRLLTYGCPRPTLRAAAIKSGGALLLHWAVASSPDELDDESVADLVATFDDRAADAGRLLRLLFERGDNVRHAALNAPSTMVRSVVGGDERMTAAEAWTLTQLDGDSHVVGIDPADQDAQSDAAATLRMVWAGVGYNPRCPADLRAAIATAASRTAARRLDVGTRNEITRDLHELSFGLERKSRYADDPVDFPFEQVGGDGLQQLLRRAVRKRPGTCLALLRNPNVPVDRWVEVLQTLGDLPDWLTVKVDAAVDDAAIRFDTVGWTDYPTVAEIRNRQPEVAATVAPDSDARPAVRTAADRDHLAEMAAEPPGRIVPIRLAELLVERLGDRPQRWRTAMELAVDFDGTAAELCDAATALDS